MLIGIYFIEYFFNIFYSAFFKHLYRYLIVNSYIFTAGLRAVIFLNKRKILAGSFLEDVPWISLTANFFQTRHAFVYENK